MKSTFCAIAALALFAATASSALAELKIAGETRVPEHRMVRLKAEGVLAGAALIWDVYPEENADIVEQKGTLFFTAPPGVYKVKLRSIKGEETETARHTVEVGKVVPTPPVPPGPVPPTPPGPTPPPSPVSNPRILIVFETAEASKLPPAKQAILYGKTVREYLNAKCPVGPDGTTREWRIYDQNVDLAGEAKGWQEMMARPRTSVPWVVIVAGEKIVHEGALPENVEAAMSLFKTLFGS